MRTIETWLAAKIIALDLNRVLDKVLRLPYSYEREVIMRKVLSARDMLLTSPRGLIPMADSTGRLPKGEQAYDCIVNESRRHQPTYADGRAAHRGDMVADSGRAGQVRVQSGGAASRPLRGADSRHAGQPNVDAVPRVGAYTEGTLTMAIKNRQIDLDNHLFAASLNVSVTNRSRTSSWRRR